MFKYSQTNTIWHKAAVSQISFLNLKKSMQGHKHVHTEKLMISTDIQRGKRTLCICWVNMDAVLLGNEKMEN